MISKRQATDMQSQYERLDRHVRTSASVRELMHWDSIRVASRLSGSRNMALRKEIAARLRKLKEVKQ